MGWENDVPRNKNLPEYWELPAFRGVGGGRVYVYTHISQENLLGGGGGGCTCINIYHKKTFWGGGGGGGVYVYTHHKNMKYEACFDLRDLRDFN